MRASLSRRRGHLALDRRHRQRPERQQAIVEGLEGEGSPLAFGRLPPPARDLELADLVRAGLPGPRDVAIDLDLGVHPRRSRLDHLPHRALTVPPERVDPRVDDWPPEPEAVGLEDPEALVLGDEQAHLLGEPLAVQTPPLDERVAHQAAPEPADRVAVLELPLYRELEMMTGVRLVVRRGRRVVQETLGEATRVHVVDPGPRAVGARGWVEGARHGG